MYLTLDLFKKEGENEIQVLGEAGNSVDDGSTMVDDDNRRHMYVAVQPNLPEGRYIVHWKTLADDDQETFGGVFAFYVGVTPTAGQLHEDRELEEQAEADAEATSQAGEADETAEETATSVAISTPTPADVGRDNDSDAAPAGLIVGIVVAAVAVVGIGVGTVAITRWRRE